MTLLERGASEIVTQLFEEHGPGGGESIATIERIHSDGDFCLGLPPDAARRLTGPWFQIQVSLTALLEVQLGADTLNSVVRFVGDWDFLLSVVLHHETTGEVQGSLQSTHAPQR